jgi:group II intron reverse transcriptase/maturase
MGVTKPNEIMVTKLQRIAMLSKQNSKMEFKWLMPHFTEENLICCFNELDGKKAVGIDGKTKEEYGKELAANIKMLISKMKNMAYKPCPVKQVLISKGNGKFRPLGISNIEDKIVQMMFSKILEAIYDPIFCEFSYGFRRNRSAHMAIRETIEYLRFNNVKRVIEVDIENFFGTIKHKNLIEMLELKIKDKTFMQYISRQLKVGIATRDGIERSDTGLPQGSIFTD